MPVTPPVLPVFRLVTLAGETWLVVGEYMMLRWSQVHGIEWDGVHAVIYPLGGPTGLYHCPSSITEKDVEAFIATTVPLK